MFLSLLSQIYALIVHIRNLYYDRYAKIIKVDSIVISVGNLSVGGTGKTPFVQMLSKHFISKQANKAVIGYKRKSKGIVTVCDGKEILSTAEKCGDEMLLLANNLNVPVVVGEKKYMTATYVAEQYAPDLIIVDDGFQHRKLYRNIDIVIIDKATLNNNLLPAGRLREPLHSIKRANIIALTGNTLIDESFTNYINKDAIIIRVAPIQGTPYNYLNNKHYSIQELENIKKNIVAFAGIAKPERFFDMLQNNAFAISTKIEFTDHYNYKIADILKIIDIATQNNTKYLATTEKDAIKFLTFKELFLSNKIELLVFPITLSIIEGEKDFYSYLQRFLK